MCFRIAGILIAFLAIHSQGAIEVGTGPAFHYRYDPRTAGDPDFNAIHQDIAYIKESPQLMSCSYLTPVVTGTPGTITYEFRAASGYAIQHIEAFQRGTLYGPGLITGEYYDGTAWHTFFSTPPYAGSGFSHSRWAYLRHINSTVPAIRYTLRRDGSGSIQFLRDCTDVPIGLEFMGTVIEAALAQRTVVLLPQSAEWRYLDTGANLGAAWSAPFYNDSVWRRGGGQFGYGEGDENTIISYGPNAGSKYITTYFRTTFSLTNRAAIERLWLGLVRDDGAVIYLNGQEVFRNNLPAGEISHNTLAETPNGLIEREFLPAEIDPDFLIDGLNTIAVEVHQNSPTTTDMSFLFDLSATLREPVVQAAVRNKCAEISRPPGYTLQSAPTVVGPWQSVSNAPNPLLVCGDQTNAFFRLIWSQTGP